MTINKGKLAVFSLILNFCLIGVALFFIIKRWHFQYLQDHPSSYPYYQDNPQFAEQVNIERAYTKSAKIIMLGNSHVYKAHWDELLNRGDVGNRGIGSDITAGYLHRLEYVFNAHPAICFIEGGANDIWYHIPEDTTIHNLSILVDTLLHAGIIPVLHTLAPFAVSEPRSNSFNKTVLSLNEKIKKMAEDKKVSYIDLYNLLSEKGTLAPIFAQSDNVHFTASAYLLWKNEIQIILNQYHL